MLDDILKKIPTSLIVCLVLFAGLVCLILFNSEPSSNSNNEVDKNLIVKNEIIDLFNQIGEEYSFRVKRTFGSSVHNWNYYTDSKLEMYDGDFFSNNSYLVYNNKKYVVNLNDYKINNYSGNIIYMNDFYTNKDLIKNIIYYCDLEIINNVKVNCKINLSDYVREYNSMYNESLTVENDKEMLFTISYYSTKINKIVLDYTYFNSLISNSKENLIYEIEYLSIDKEDFDNIYQYYKDYLK